MNDMPTVEPGLLLRQYVYMRPAIRVQVNNITSEHAKHKRYACYDDNY